MENFVNNTDVSFSQLFKKEGWFSRLIFSQLIVFPIYISIFRLSRPLRNMSGLSFYYLLITCFIWIAGHLTIGLLLWKKRNRLTITVSIILLWILFIWSYVFPVLALAMMLSAVYEGLNNVPINHWIYKIIYATALTVIALSLTIIWTRNLKRLKHFCS